MELTTTKKNSAFYDRLIRFSKDYTILIVITVLFVFFSLASPHFLTFFNIRNIFLQTTAVAITGIGASMIIISGGMDMSLGMTLCVSSCAAAWLIKFGGWNPWLSLLIAMIIGAAMGVINGVLRAYVGLPLFVVTLGTQLVGKGFSQIITNASPIPGMPKSIQWIGRGYIGGDKRGIPISVVAMIVLYIIISIILMHTKFGRNLYATGGNAEAAYFAGINVKRTQLMIHIIGSMFAALGGIFLMTRLDSAAITNGESYPFDCTIASVMGGITLGGGRGKPVHSLMGALFLTLFFNGMTMLNVNPFVQNVLKGVVLVLAITVDALRSRQRI